MPDGSECGAEACTELKVGGFVPLSTADWVGFDVKTSFTEYASVIGVAGGTARVLESLRAVVASGVDCEFRTTVPRT